MAFTSETKKELENYISGHLPNKEWYESHFYPFIENKSLRDRLIVEFINARKIYKFFEGLQASDELLLAQIKTQVTLIYWLLIILRVFVSVKAGRSHLLLIS